jgi:hypothetical protein
MARKREKLMKLIFFCLFLPLLLTACSLDLAQDSPLPTRPVVIIPSVTPPPSVETTVTLLTLPDNLYDSLPVMQGICFESAWDAAGRVFIMRSAEEHIQFYDAADNSTLCRRGVERFPFDFTGGDVLAGLWNRGIGCTASHEIVNYQGDDLAKNIQIEVLFITDGDCPYELVRGFWVGIPNAQDYEITIDWSE